MYFKKVITETGDFIMMSLHILFPQIHCYITRRRCVLNVTGSAWVKTRLNVPKTHCAERVVPLF